MDGDVDRETVVVVVDRGASARRTREILRWLRWLLPTALLVIAPTAMPFAGAPDIITIDADAVESGPLSLADAIARAGRSGRDPTAREARPTSRPTRA